MSYQPPNERDAPGGGPREVFTAFPGEGAPLAIDNLNDPSSGEALTGQPLGSGETTQLVRVVGGSGASKITGRVVRQSTSYDIDVVWQDTEGNAIFTDSIASGVAAGTETDIVITDIVSPSFEVQISDAGGASGTFDFTINVE